MLVASSCCGEGAIKYKKLLGMKGLSYRDLLSQQDIDQNIQPELQLIGLDQIIYISRTVFLIPNNNSSVC